MKKHYQKQLAKSYWKEIAESIILSIVITVLSVIGPLLLKYAVDENMDGMLNKQALVWYLILLTMLYAAKFSYNRFQFWFAENFKNKETISLYKKAFKLSYQDLTKMEPTYLTERIQSTMDTIFQLYCSSITGIFVAMLTMLITLFVVFRMSPALSVLYFLQIPIQYFGFQKLLNGENSKLSQYGIQMQEIRAKGNKNIKAVVSDVDSIKQYGNDGGLLPFLEKSIAAIQQITREGNGYAMDICTILNYVCALLKNMAYLFLIFLYVKAKVSVGDLIYLTLMNDVYYEAIGSIIEIRVNLRDLRAALLFVENEIEEKQESDGNVELEQISALYGTVKNVGYGEQTLVQEGSFSFEKGDVIGFAGDSGTGKSTFVKMLVKFLHSDHIFINGIGLQEISNASLRKKVCYVPQNAYLLPCSIRENMTLGREVPEEKWKQLEQMDFIKKFLTLEQGLDTLVLENAANLSGGDRQKIILGRIFLQDPEVILLDESFHAIDERTGDEIMQLILSLYKERIILLISHSEHYFKYCTKRLEIRNGQLIQLDGCQS